MTPTNPTTPPANHQPHTPPAETTVKKSSRNRVTIIVASVAVVALVACVGLGVWRVQRVQALQDECGRVAAQVNKAQKKLTMLVKSDEVSKALNVSDKQVLKEDVKTLSTLKDAADSATKKVTIPACEVGLFALDSNPAESVRGVLKTVQGKTVAVDDAVASVNKAVGAKVLADAKGKLQQTVDAASKLLADSDGKVADGATRDQLKKAVDQAAALLKAGKESDPAKYSTKPVDDAVAAVNASMEAKRQADEQAAAAQAAAQAQRSYTPTYNGGSYSGGGYSGGSGGGSYTPPANNNGGGSSGGSMTWEEFNKGVKTGACDDPTQFCPLG